MAQSTTIAQIYVPNKVVMRAAPSTPSSIEYSTIGLTDSINVYAITAAAFGFAGSDASSINFTVASGLTQYRPYTVVNNNNSTTAYLGMNAEL
jgi:hypothetical protein